jgi:lipopolysaccharide export system protein LptC
MRERLTSLIAVVLLAFVSATSYWYARVLKIPKATFTAAPGTPDFEAEKLVITQFDAQGRARHKLFAERLLHYGDTDNVDLASPRLVSLRPDEPQFEVRAERGQVENAGEKLHLHGNVDLRRAAGADAPALRARTEYLLAIPDFDRYSTDKPVQVERGDSRILAEGGMQLDNVARTAQFEGKVRIVMPPPQRREP